MANKEVKIILNTQEGYASFMTEKFTGNLCSVILDSPERISLLIESELGYMIFKNVDIQGNHCLSIRNRTIAPIENMRDVTQFDKFNLNESLRITIFGQKDVEVSLIFRLE